MFKIIDYCSIGFGYFLATQVVHGFWDIEVNDFGHIILSKEGWVYYVCTFEQ